MIYREDGWIAEVELIEKKDDDKGETFKLRVNHTIGMPQFIKPEAVPNDGDTFEVWRAHGFGAYAGWHLSER